MVVRARAPVKAPIGATVRIYLDCIATISPGDAVETPSGRLYLVAGVRVQGRGKRIGRQHLTCIVAEPPAPEGVNVIKMRWYRRRRRR